MKILLNIPAVVLLTFLTCVAEPSKATAQPSTTTKTPNSTAINFDWRKKTGDFLADKPGYLILCTEDALTYSKVLPRFVKQKESMGFYVYVATEQDYGTGKIGNSQAAQVREWLRDFQKRTNAKYALFIGDSSPKSSNLPSPTIPDGEHGGLEPSYCDLDGKWVDLYLNTKEKDTRSAWVQMCAGSILIGKAMKEGGKRQDDLIVSRISYVGNEIGNSSYDLDRILEKTIRYELDTVTGKNLDWRANALSVTTNYGEGNWDAPLLKAAEREGGTFELRSSAGWLGNLPPENVIDGRAVNAELLVQTRRRGLLATMSHGWNRGGEGIASQEALFRDIDPRYPSAVSVAACTAFALADNCNMGQAWLRSVGIFAIGTGWSGNNNCRIPFHTRLLEDRVSVGEAGKNEVVQYGDPSLHVLPPKGMPVRALQVSPAFSGRYEERTLAPGLKFKPVTETYTLTNQSKEKMRVTVECDAAWVALSTGKLTLKPGETAKVEVASNDRAQKLAPGVHVAKLRFLRDDGQRDERRLAFNLQPVTLTSAYSFDETNEGNRFPDLAVATRPKPYHDHSSLWLLAVERGPHWNAFVKLGEKVPGYAPESQGRVGGALRLDTPKDPFRRRLDGLTQWRGASASLWFKVDALPAAKKSTTILTAPFALTLDDQGNLSFAQGEGGKPASLDVIKLGEWHFIQLRSDIEGGKVKASLDGKTEVTTAAARPPVAALTLGSFAGVVDEIRTWSGELSDAAVRSELAAATKPFVMPAPALAPDATYADDGVLRAPKELPAVLDLNDPQVKLDIASILAANQLTCTLRDAPKWLDFKDGVFSLKTGTDFDRIDFGGYDLFLVLTAKSGHYAGCVCEHPLKVRIPVPAVRIRMQRTANDLISFVNAGDRYGKADRPLAKGVIRYTTDGSPGDANSAIYSQPFKAVEGMKVTARFFYLGEYPMAPVTSSSEFGISREKWKALSVSGHPSTLAAAGNAFDAKPETAWTNKGETLPQYLAWDLGEAVKVTALSCHSSIANSNGRISDYVLQASDDGKVWRKVQSGSLTNTPTAQRIELPQPCTSRYLKLEATTLQGGKDMVITELEVYSR